MKDGHKARIDPQTGNPMYDDKGEMQTEPIPKDSLPKPAAKTKATAATEPDAGKGKGGKTKASTS